VIDHFELPDSRLLGITIDDASSKHAMTRELRLTLAASAIRWPAFRNHMSCMADVILLALRAFMSSLGIKGLTKSWEAREHNQQFGKNESIDIGKS